MNPRAVFLDRDGVLNEAIVRDGKPYPPASIEELVVVPDAARALARLRRAGYRLVVVTNQPDVARGGQRREVVEAINQFLLDALPLDEVRVCYHDDPDQCSCRKPAPGLLLQAPDHDLPQSTIVGDRWRDIEAGRRAGIGAAVLIERGYREAMRSEPDARVSSLTEAVDWILAPNPIARLKVKLFADGASLAEMLALSERPYIRGFTTNPTLMRKAGVVDYARFGREVIARIPDRPISFEVLADELAEMEAQAREIARWGANVYVKIPVSNTRGESTCDLVQRLSHEGIHVNVTAVMTSGQVAAVADALRGGAASNVSLFAGRIADTGRDPVSAVTRALALVSDAPSIELIWASPREVLNVVQADGAGCQDRKSVV